VKRWVLQEISLVAVGADPNAHTRKKQRADARDKNKRQETDMELDELIVAAEDALKAVDEAVAEAGHTVTEEQGERVRKLRATEDEAAAEAAAKEEADKAEAERKRAEEEAAAAEDAEPTEEETLAWAAAGGLRTSIDASVQKRPAATRTPQKSSKVSLWRACRQASTKAQQGPDDMSACSHCPFPFGQARPDLHDLGGRFRAMGDRQTAVYVDDVAMAA
jgi:hypothetical protein